MITQIQKDRITETVSRMRLPAGLGDNENACSIAAINLALTGQLTDTIPECMSEVIGKWIIITQDAMPDEMRNTDEWKQLLPFAAGTGRAHEEERLALLLEHMWSVALPLIQPIADAQGFGAEWRTMTTERTESAATAAARAAWAEAAAAAAEAEAAAKAQAAATAEATARAAAWAATAQATARAATRAAWESLNPCQLLADLIAVGEK